MIKIKRLIRRRNLILADNVLEEDEELRRPFIPKSDDYVSDIDGYYLVLFLEQQYGKKDLGGIFKKPNGKKYTSGYIKSVKEGKKGVTVDFYHAVQEFIPDFENQFREFVDFVNNGYNKTPEEISRDLAISNKEKEKQKYIDLANDSTAATSNFCKFLVAITGLNPAQIQDAIGADPNESKVNDLGKRVIPKEMVQKAVDTFNFEVSDFKNWKQSGSTITNPQIEEIVKKYVT